MGGALSRIVNFTKPAGDPHPLSGKSVPVGRVRYCSSEIAVNAKRDNVPVTMDPTDLLARRTALFGMSRSGKSNTIKTVSAAIFMLRDHDPNLGRIGQLIFDTNGEYCNDNPQDNGCLRNVWRETRKTAQGDVVTYGLHPHPNDLNRRLVKVNFFGETPTAWSDRESVASAMDMLLAGKAIIDESMPTEGAHYVKNFLNTAMDLPPEWDKGTQIRYQRCVIVYRALLFGAGFAPPQNMGQANIAGLFGKNIRESLDAAGYEATAATFEKHQVEWTSLVASLKDLRKFLSSDAGMNFDKLCSESSRGKSWSDDRLVGLLSLLERPQGIARLRGLKTQHSPDVSVDYAVKIVDDLVAGRLVIMDQSTGAPDLIQRASERIMWELFNRQKETFISPARDKNDELVLDENNNIKPPPDVIVYAEEAHNLLPAKNADLSSVWARIVKEGSKFHIGMVYSTQEPSSILSNILKNTDNWFVAHLNNQDEMRELRKYYDFEMFAGQILKVPDTGFVRMRCLSNPYIVPIQVDRFAMKLEEGK